jgi:hypothetical protein
MLIGEGNPGNNRRLISEARFRIRAIDKMLHDLRYEKACLEQVVLNYKYIKDAEKNRMTNKWQAKLKHGQKHRHDMLKSVMNN